MRRRVVLLLGLTGFLPLLAAASCRKEGTAAGEWKATHLGSGGRWVPMRPGREQSLTLGVAGKGKLVMHTAIGVKEFTLTWEAAGNKVTIRMKGQVYSTGSLGADGKSLLTADMGGTQTKWVRTKA